jgi:hypothetical protein
MKKRLKQGALGLVVILAAAQLIQPDRTNPPIDASRTIAAHAGSATGLAAVLGRSCGDCHSNATLWPWYTRVAPVSWLMASGVRKGREVVNFSEWGAYSPDARRTLLSASCEAASSGRMPGPYAYVRPDTRLSREDVEIICAAARQAEPDTVGMSQ